MAVPPSTTAEASALAGAVDADEGDLGADASQAAGAEQDRSSEQLQVAVALADELQRRIARLAVRLDPPPEQHRTHGASAEKRARPTAPHPPEDQAATGRTGSGAEARLDNALARMDAARKRLAAHRAALAAADAEVAKR